MSEPIRVLQVLGRMNRGGAESMIMNLYREIDREKVQFDFVVHTDKKCAFDDEIRSLGGRIFSVPRYNGRNHLQYVNAWKKFFKEHPEYKIIHGHIYSVASIYLKIAKRFGLVTIAHSHNTSEGKGLTAFAKRIIQLPLKNIADYLFACSDKAGEWLYGRICIKQKNYYLLKNAIDTEVYRHNPDIRHKMRKELNVENNFVLGHVGRFNTQKNHGFLLDIFAEVYKKDRNCRLLLVGDGNLRAELEEKMNKLGIRHAVIMTGVRADVNDLLQAMDCFVFPSLHEGLPVTVVEAQAAGLSCFISDRITKEVCITELVKQLPINQGTKCWVETLALASKEETHKNVTEKIVNAGYDIKTTSKWLQEFYINRGEEEQG